MLQERWLKIRELLEGAIEQPIEERAGFILRHATDDSVCAEALELLKELEAGTQFLESPPALVAGAVLAERWNGPRLSAGDLLAGRFRIDQFLGEGGMGEVYAADDLESGVKVAIKIVRGGGIPADHTIARLREELILGRAVTHRNVCRIFDLHQHAGSPEVPRKLLFLTMELLHGETLAARLARSGPLAVADGLAVAKQLAEGLAAAHAAGVIHGDLKAANIMLEPVAGGRFRAVLMDFGVAAAYRGDGSTIEASPFGTPAYVAPEQRLGRITPASDVYSWGIVLYEAVTGAPPDRQPAPRMRARVPDLPPWLDALITRCLEIDPAVRPPDGMALVEALRGTRRTWLRASIAAAVLVLAAVTAFRVIRPPTERPVVAVLGFRNAAGLDNRAYLALLLEMALDADLASAQTVRVVPAVDVARSVTELHLGDANPLPPGALARLRMNLGADFIVLGTYAPSSDPRSVRVEIAVQDAHSGKTVASAREEGSETNLPALVSRIGATLRHQLRPGAAAPVQEDNVRMALPGSLDAMRLYAEGLRRLREYNALEAKDFFEQAIAAEPDYPQAHSALAQAWAVLGYDSRAREEAQRAYEFRARVPVPDRWLVEAAWHEANHDKQKAIAAYRELVRFAPDNPDYLLLLAKAQNSTDALRTIAELRRMPPPVRDDPRIDLAEAQAAHTADAYSLEQSTGRQAARKAGRIGAGLLEAAGLMHEGWASWILGQPAQAESSYQRARELFAQAGDQNGVGQALRGLALVAQYRGELARSAQIYTEAYEVLRKIGSLEKAAVALNGLAMVASTEGRLNDALGYYRQSLALCTEVRSPICIGTELNNIGYVLYRRGAFAEARHNLDAAAQAFEQGKGFYGRSFALSSLGDLLEAQGKLDEADRCLREARQLSRRLQDRVSESSTDVSLSAVLRDRGQLAEASRLCLRAIQEQAGRGEADSAAKSRILLARIELDQMRPAAAESGLEQALPVLRRAGRKDEIAVAQALSAWALAMGGRRAEAAAAGAEAFAMLKGSENRLARVTVLLSLAVAETYLRNLGRARNLLRSAGAEAEEYGFATLAAEAHRHSRALELQSDRTKH